jgi:hypothetical protein
MFIGQSLLVDDEAGSTYYTPWFPRGGSGATLAVELIAASAGGSVIITPQSKNSEDDDQVGSLKSHVASGSVTTLGITSWFAGSRNNGFGATGITDTQGFEELVRFKVVVNDTEGLGFVHIRMLNPAWSTD